MTTCLPLPALCLCKISFLFHLFETLRGLWTILVRIRILYRIRVILHRSSLDPGQIFQGKARVESSRSDSIANLSSLIHSPVPETFPLDVTPRATSVRPVPSRVREKSAVDTPSQNSPRPQEGLDRSHQNIRIASIIETTDFKRYL